MTRPTKRRVIEGFPHQERLLDEWLELDARYSRLVDFLEGDTPHNPAAICLDEIPLLHMQRRLMGLLSGVMFKRIGMNPGDNFDQILNEGNHLIVRAQMAKKARKPLVGPFTAKQLERAHRRNARVVEKKKRGVG